MRGGARCGVLFASRRIALSCHAARGVEWSRFTGRGIGEVGFGTDTFYLLNVIRQLAENTHHYTKVKYSTFCDSALIVSPYPNLSISFTESLHFTTKSAAGQTPHRSKNGLHPCVPNRHHESGLHPNLTRRLRS